MAGNYTTQDDIYLLNGIDIESLSAFVESSEGFNDIPERKGIDQYNWPDEQGVDMNLDALYFEARYPRLAIIVHALSYASLLANLAAIKAEF